MFFLGSLALDLSSEGVFKPSCILDAMLPVRRSSRLTLQAKGLGAHRRVRRVFDP